MGVKFAIFIYFLLHMSVQEEFEMLTRVGGYPWFSPPDNLVGENLNLPPPTWLSKLWCHRLRLPASFCSRKGNLIGGGVNLGPYSKIYILCWVALTVCHISPHSPDQHLIPRAASQAGCSFLCSSFLCKFTLVHAVYTSNTVSYHQKGIQIT